MLYLMDNKYSEFEREIYSYCDANSGKKILFPAFMNLWNGENYICKKDLAVLTSKIISDLEGVRVLVEVRKPKRLESPYGYYRVKPHKELIKSNNHIKRKFNWLN
jgi:hypothetical protein